MRDIFGAGGNWYKGNLHMHTLRSDGLLSPQKAIGIYREAGYDFLALTDHWVQSETHEGGEPLLLSGCEWDTGNMTDSPVFHIVGVGMESKVGLEASPALPPQRIIDAILAAGGVAILAHPLWSVTDPADCMGLRGLSGAEIYNSVSGLPWNGERADSSTYIDIWASKGRYFGCMAADDSHVYGGEQTRAFTMVKAESRSAGAIKDAIRAGNFYASQGPRLESVRISESAVEVECSPVETIVFNSNTVWCGDRVFTGERGRTEAVYQIKPTDRYVRVMLIDASGRKAWSSPIPIQKAREAL